MKKIGDAGEVIAIEYLQKQGYSISDTNFKFWRFGEVDIIASKEGKYYFIEVKYRSHLGYGTPEEAITKHKLHKCRKTVEYYCVTHGIDMECIQFDVITVLRQKQSHSITHYKHIEI